MSQSTASSVALLKALNYRISSTTTDKLPAAATQIASSLWNCRNILSAATDTKQNNEASIVVHRFKTQLGSLLNDRTIEGRWSAVVLIKATIEAGGVEILSKSNVWVRSLLGILKKPEPPTTRSLAVLTLTRIFMLTWDYSNLIREITTPALTTFIPTSLANIENKRCSSGELQTTLEAFAVLLPRHPTIFRANDAKLRQILTNILFSADGRHFTNEHREVANRLWVLLANCTPKQGGSEKWEETLKAAVTAAHSTSDRLFRSVVEDWQSTTGVPPPSQQILNGSVSVRVGIVADLLTRLFSIVLPQGGKFGFVKPNNQISKDEREAMFSVLPRIHAAGIDIAISLQDRLGSLFIPCAQGFIDQILRVFPSETIDTHVRCTLYRFLAKALDLIGPTMSKNDFVDIAPIVKSCCSDVLPDDDQTSVPSVNSNQAGIKQQLGLAQTSQTHPTEFHELRIAASTLLATTLSRLDATCVLPKLRAQIDRTAALVRSHDLLLASILNPSQKPNTARTQASLLPILARTHPDSISTETLLRPRMPPIKTGYKRSAGDDAEDEEDEEDEEEMEAEEAEPEPIPELGPEPEVEPVYEHQDDFTVSQPDTAEPTPLAALAQEPPSSYATAFSDPQATPTAKRPAAETAEQDIAAKRMRSEDAVGGGEQVITTRTVVEIPVTASDVAMGGAAADDEDDGSGSDFEMPTLTAELSSDEEE
ncbi:unnamed protein product [Zymoseptoria tritici ST99CH_1E4]|uniref:Pre-rRNA-processing protein RIX1 n=1 Tax=Zymoseptoria tritici ST99CH_1E4 TaxID=1276532 RepID=A0A2H1GUN4_ZYMTR|nr:unnamed protein product [Zymoseptoria tritici ST99CH_1E4]